MQFKFSCRECGKKHNSLIHPGFPLSSCGGSSSQSSGKSMKKADGKALSSNFVTNDEESEQEDAEQREAKVTSELPSVHVPTAHWNIPGDIQLTDPEFNTSSRIDLLIGAEHFYRFLSEPEVKRISQGTGLPVLIDSVFGWIVTGKVSDTYNNPVSCLISAAPDNLEILLQQFWEIESNEDQPAWSKKERDCEEHFVKTVSRTEEGRYVVCLPKHVNFAQMLGDSRSMALTRFLRLEKQLEQNLEMRKQYNTFMQEYLDLGQMREVREHELRGKDNAMNIRKFFYLPYHAVLKESSSTTKVRVVFDGSACTDSGYSLNDVLLKGPTIQDELLCLLLRFRKHEVALVGDVEKMYRQALVHEASNALVKDFYVDDYIGGASSIEGAIQLQNNLGTLLKKGGFALRKWCSNRPEVLTGILADQLGTNLSISFEISPEEKVKTLEIT
ncbi:uncharacterized protein LOC135712840 [Ochlerotatus camptorhynchus]|uniref:uncharacterized protein LOC135712840 n=1 Tax=Ochlerotatus camptorhynchus TaxID=644619 RepID=UPI0031D809AD